MNRTKNYIILDTETATLPFVREMELTSEQKKKIAIAKPLSMTSAGRLRTAPMVS